MLTEHLGTTRLELEAADVLFASIEIGTRQCVGALVYKFVTNDAASIPLFYFNFDPEFDGNGNNVTIQWASQGIAFITGAGA